MRKLSKEVQDKVNELKCKYDQIAAVPNLQQKRQIVKNTLVRNFLDGLQENRPSSTKKLNSIKINPEIADFTRLTKNAMSFMKGVLLQQNPAESSLRDALEYGREIINQLHNNMSEMVNTGNVFREGQQKEIYANIVKVLDVIGDIENKFSYSKLSDDEKILFDLDKKIDDLKTTFAVMAAEEGLDVVEQKIYYLDHPILKTNTKKMSPYAQDLVKQINEKQDFLKELLAVYKQDQEPEDVRKARVEGHKKMLEWVEKATFVVKKDIEDLKGVKKGEEVPSPRTPGED